MPARNVAVSCQKRKVYSAQIARSRLTVPVIWLYTGEFTQARNQRNVVSVIERLERPIKLAFTAEFTLDRNRTNVQCVTRRFVRLHIETHT